MRTVVAAAVLLFSLQSTPSELDRVVKRASVYADQYMKDFGTIAGEERYFQTAAWEDINVRGRPLRSARQRSMVSDFLSLPVANTWIGFRHVREVDGVTLDPLHRPVLRDAFDETTAE